MLLASLLSLLVSVLGWSQFGKVEGANNKLDVSELISTNYIPSVFLVSCSPENVVYSKY